MTNIRLTTSVHVLAAFLLSALCTLMLSSCDESLPPRDDPQILKPTIVPGYYINRTQENMYFTILVRNTYTETFIGQADIIGSLVIQWDGHPAFVKTFQISEGDLKKTYFNAATGLMVTTASTYNPVSKTLTIPENEYAAIQLRWDLHADDSTDIRDSLEYYPDPRNPGIVRSTEFTLIATAGLRLYAKQPMLYPTPLAFKQKLLYLR